MEVAGGHGMNVQGVRHYKEWKQYYREESKRDKREIKKEWLSYTKKVGFDLEWRKVDDRKVSGLCKCYWYF